MFGEGAAVEDLLRSADDAMAAARRAGRNRAAVWNGDVRVGVGADIDEKD